MRPLNEIVSDNARVALEMAKKEAQATGSDRVSLSGVGSQMAALMGRAEESVQRQLRFYFKSPPARTWRIDYIEAFATVLGVKASSLLEPKAKLRLLH